MFMQLRQLIIRILFLTFLVVINISCHKAEVTSSYTGNLKFYGGPLDDVPTAAIATSDGGFAITGYTNRNLNNDMFLMKLDHNGNQQWFKTYGGPKDDKGNALVQTADGGYLVTGSTNSFGKAIFNNSSFLDVYAVRTNPNGDTIWTRAYGYNTPGYASEFDDYANAVCNDASGNHYIGGYTFNIAIHDTAYPGALVVKIKDNGKAIWMKAYDPVYPINNNSIQGFTIFLTDMMVDKDGNLVTGTFSDSFIINKIRPDGSIIWKSRMINAVSKFIAYGYVNHLVQKADGSYSFLATNTDEGPAPIYIAWGNVSNDGSMITRLPIATYTANNPLTCGTLSPNGDFVVASSLLGRLGNNGSLGGSGGPGGFFLYETNISGNTKLLNTLGGWPVSIISYNHGNYFIVGYSSKSGSSRTGIFTEWVKSDGTLK